MMTLRWHRAIVSCLDCWY